MSENFSMLVFAPLPPLRDVFESMLSQCTTSVASASGCLAWSSGAEKL